MQRFVTLHGLDGTKTYSYAARGFFGLEVILHTLHAQLCAKGESWLYVAVPEGCDPASLRTGEKLYVGSQTQDRMFRGDGMGRKNFHHAQMRAGNPSDPSDHLINHLRAGRGVEIFRIDAGRLNTLVATTAALRLLDRLVAAPLSPKTHRAWWFEQYMLLMEPPPIWRWNERRADRRVAALW